MLLLFVGMELIKDLKKTGAFTTEECKHSLKIYDSFCRGGNYSEKRVTFH